MSVKHPVDDSCRVGSIDQTRLYILCRVNSGGVLEKNHHQRHPTFPIGKTTECQHVMY